MINCEITSLGAAEIARLIAKGELSSRQTVDAFIARIEQINPQLNGVVVPLFDQARKSALAADEKQASGHSVGSLHGVPITIKECFHVSGTASTMGLTHLQEKIEQQDGILVERLRTSGAIVLAKTNVPQMMLCHESDNPVYGRTNNPWDQSRTPGGSSGGEAAIIAAGGSPLGLGSDLGGSIRIPAHFCGIAGIKPTSRRLPRSGTVENLRGMDAMQFQPGPMARRVEDLRVALEVLCSNSDEASLHEPSSAPLRDSRNVSLVGMRIAYWTDDQYFSPAPAISRIVTEAAEALRQQGAEVVPFSPPEIDSALRLYYAILAADGGADLRRLIYPSRVDRRVGRLLRLASMPKLLRLPLVCLLRLFSQRHSANLLSEARARSADEYWQLTYAMMQYKRRFQEKLNEGHFQAMLFPPHALPAPPHGKAIDLIPAASYSFLPNLLGIPAGVVSLSRVGTTEESNRSPSRDRVDRIAQETERGSAGLPVGVQIAAGEWREDIVLAVMAALEEAFRSNDDYPTVEKMDEW